MRNNKTILDLIFSIAQKYHTKVFLVGGPVRDMIMANKKSLVIGQDLDIAVEKNYQKIGEELAQRLNAKIIHYPQFMTITLYAIRQTPDAIRHIDIAQTREELYYKPAVLPKVYPSTIIKDLKRRDFTINAMAIELKPSTVDRQPLTVLDPFNGQIDLKQKLVRVLHEKSFIDDPTRIFRAIRFATRFGFKIEPETKELMKTAISQGYLKLLSGERILYELKMIMNEPKSLKILKSLQSYRVILSLFEIKLPKRFFAEHKKLNNDKLKLIHFFSYIPQTFWSKYPLSKEIIKAVQQVKEFAQQRKLLLKAKKPSQIYNILKRFDRLALELLMTLEIPQLQQKIKNYLNSYCQVKLFTTGDMLKALKLKPGPNYKKIMNELIEQKLDGVIKSKDDEIKYIVRKYCNA